MDVARASETRRVRVRQDGAVGRAPAVPVAVPSRPSPVRGLLRGGSDDPVERPADSSTTTSSVRLQRLARDRSGVVGRASQEETGSPLPPRLQVGLEGLSGMSLGAVRVHYDSPHPADVGALGLAHGDHIHLGPGQREHLAHEAWHVVQQRGGRAGRPGSSSGSVVTTDRGLEVEAEQMGMLASVGSRTGPRAADGAERPPSTGVVQLLTPAENAALIAHLTATPWLGHGLPTPAQLTAMTRFTPADLNALLVLPQCVHGGWAAAAALGGVPATRPVAEIVNLASSALGGAPPTVQTIVLLLTRFTFAEVHSIVTSPNNAGSFSHRWADLEHLAGIRDTPANLVTLGQSSNLATAPWLESQVHALTQVGRGESKRDVNGLRDRQRSCWSWATQSFNDRPPGADLFMWTYLNMRTDFPPTYGVTRNHAAARDAATDNVAFRAWLDTNAGLLQNVVDQFAAGASPHRERDAQRAMMEIMLAASGFVVLPPGTPSRWYIGMHERRTNISWEHWWIQTRQGGVIETFPYRDPAAGGDGAGKKLFFTGNQNSGNPATDFTHLVPVQDLLPDQKTIIKRALTRAGRAFTDDLP